MFISHLNADNWRSIDGMTGFYQYKMAALCDAFTFELWKQLNLWSNIKSTGKKLKIFYSLLQLLFVGYQKILGLQKLHSLLPLHGELKALQHGDEQNIPDLPELWRNSCRKHQFERRADSGETSANISAVFGWKRSQHFCVLNSRKKTKIQMLPVNLEKLLSVHRKAGQLKLTDSQSNRRRS